MPRITMNEITSSHGDREKGIKELAGYLDPIEDKLQDVVQFIKIYPDLFRLWCYGVRRGLDLKASYSVEEIEQVLKETEIDLVQQSSNGLALLDN